MPSTQQCTLVQVSNLKCTLCETSATSTLSSGCQDDKSQDITFQSELVIRFFFKCCKESKVSKVPHILSLLSKDVLELSIMPLIKPGFVLTHVQVQLKKESKFLAPHNFIIRAKFALVIIVPCLPRDAIKALLFL